MKTSHLLHCLAPAYGLRTRLTAVLCVTILSLIATSPSIRAFPPAPYHLIYGIVRDQYGTPLSSSSAQILLETQSGVQVRCSLSPGVAAGVNYQLQVPMDSGVTPVPYLADALSEAAPFRIYVVINSV